MCSVANLFQAFCTIYCCEKHFRKTQSSSPVAPVIGLHFLRWSRMTLDILINNFFSFFSSCVLLLCSTSALPLLNFSNSRRSSPRATSSKSLAVCTPRQATLCDTSWPEEIKRKEKVRHLYSTCFYMSQITGLFIGRTFNCKIPPINKHL